MNDTNAGNRSRTHHPRARRSPGEHGGSSFNRHSPALRAMRKHAKNMAQDARGLAGTAGAAAREQLDPLKEYVVEKPIQSLCLAAGVGLIFGLIFFRH
jgi:ElaB/YqjD/DUF883 family membrane-anchored ribosome-binding protein